MNRRWQDFGTWLLGVVILASQATPWVPERPYIIGAACGLLGLPFARQAQDRIKEIANGDKNGNNKSKEDAER